MKRLIPFLALCLLAMGARAQSYLFYSGVASTVSNFTGQGYTYTPLYAANIYVCSGTYASTPCSATQGTLATIYASGSGGTPVVQPISSDAAGNWCASAVTACAAPLAWMAPGNYYATITPTQGLGTVFTQQFTLGSTSLGVTSNSTNATFYPTFVSGLGGAESFYGNTGFQWNPSVPSQTMYSSSTDTSTWNPSSFTLTGNGATATLGQTQLTITGTSPLEEALGATSLSFTGSPSSITSEMQATGINFANSTQTALLEPGELNLETLSGAVTSTFTPTEWEFGLNNIGFSSPAAGIMALGNGTANSITGTLQTSNDQFNGGAQGGGATLNQTHSDQGDSVNAGNSGLTSFTGVATGGTGTSRVYWAEQIDGAGNGTLFDFGNWYATAVTNSGPATLSGSAFVTLTADCGITGTVESVQFFRHTAGGSPSTTGFIGTPVPCNSSHVATLVDTGLAAVDGTDNMATGVNLAGASMAQNFMVGQFASTGDAQTGGTIRFLAPNATNNSIMNDVFFGSASAFDLLCMNYHGNITQYGVCNENGTFQGDGINSWGYMKFSSPGTLYFPDAATEGVGLGDSSGNNSGPSIWRTTYTNPDASTSPAFVVSTVDSGSSGNGTKYAPIINNLDVPLSQEDRSASTLNDAAGIVFCTANTAGTNCAFEGLYRVDYHFSWTVGGVGASCASGTWGDDFTLILSYKNDISTETNDLINAFSVPTTANQTTFTDGSAVVWSAGSTGANMSLQATFPGCNSANMTGATYNLHVVVHRIE